jgi:hypothetical protein
MLINELQLLRAKLRRMQAEAVLEPTARKALVEDAERCEALAEEHENASASVQITHPPMMQDGGPSQPPRTG